MVRRAALALDLGRVAVSNAIWEKPGPFGLTDWERVQLHPYFTERSFAHAPALASIGELAGAHHERLDGAGYHRKTYAPALGRAARILAAADCYQAMREQRPHRPALDAEGAGAELLRDAREGRLCPEAVDAVLAAAGHRVAKRPRELPAGLTDRELEVLLALAAGKTNKQIAETLGITTKTAGHHVSTSSTRRACEPGAPRPSGRSNATSCRPPSKSSSPFSMGATADGGEPAMLVSGRLSPGPIPLARPSPYCSSGGAVIPALSPPRLQSAPRIRCRAGIPASAPAVSDCAESGRSARFACASGSPDGLDHVFAMDEHQERPPARRAEGRA